MVDKAEQEVINDWKKELAAAKKLAEIKEWAQRELLDWYEDSDSVSKGERRYYQGKAAVLEELLEKLK